MLPTGEAVKIYIEPTQGPYNGFFVSDDGSCIKSLADMGYDTSSAHGQRILSSVAREFSVKYAQERFFLSPLPAEQLSGAMLFIANASAAAARKAREKLKIQERVDVRKQLGEYIESRYKDHAHKNAHAVGESNRLYRFDYGIDLAPTRQLDKQLLIDIVVNDPNSINAAYAANMDVKMAMDARFKQCIVYDDQSESKWESSSIQLLKSAAPLIASSEAKDYLHQNIAA